VLSFREILEKTKDSRCSIEKSMESNKSYHPGDASLYDGLSRADTVEVSESLRQMSLAEVLAKSGTAGIQGAAYTIAAKVYDTAVLASKATDIVPRISAIMVEEYQGIPPFPETKSFIKKVFQYYNQYRSGKE